MSRSFTSAKTAAERAHVAPRTERSEAHVPTSPLRNGMTCRRNVVAPETDHARPNGTLLAARQQQVQPQGAGGEGEDVEQEPERDERRVRGGEAGEEVC